MLSGLNKLNSLFQKLQAKIMVRIVTVLLFFVSYYSSAKIIRIEPSSNIFSYVGRFDLTSLKKVKFAHSGNQIEFQFKGNSFHIGFSNIYFEGIENKNFFSVIINGKVKQVIEGTSYLKYHKVEVNSPDSFSNVEIFKRTEALSAIAVFHGVEYTQGEFREKASKKRRIEWIGDSFLVGYGNLVSIEPSPKGNPSTGFHSINQDGYLAFGAITSRFLNADFSCVGISGKGVYRNFDKSENNTLPKIYPKIYPNSDIDNKYSFSYDPDLIVIAIGKNDFGGEISVPPDMTDSSRFVKTYLTFLELVTKNNPNSKIVLAIGGGLTDLFPMSLRRLTRFRTWMKIVKSEAEIKFSNTFGFFEFQLHNPPYGEDWHPTVFSQEKFANEITPYLKQFMGW